MGQFIDLHCHGIPQVDDGVQSDDGAMVMMTQAVDSGVKRIYMTPHVIYKGKFFPQKSELIQKVERLIQRAQVLGLPIEIKLGSEIMILPDTLEWIRERTYWGYEGTEYVLIEFMNPLDLDLIDSAINLFLQQGKKPLIAHPERYFTSADDAIKTVTRWKAMGCDLQVNRTSIYPSTKPHHREIALALIEHNLISIIATDAHHAPGRRECRMADVHNTLSFLFGSDLADRLCIENPQRLSENQKMDPGTVSQSWVSKWIRHRRFKHVK